MSEEIQKWNGRKTIIIGERLVNPVTRVEKSAEHMELKKKRYYS